LISLKKLLPLKVDFVEKISHKKIAFIEKTTYIENLLSLKKFLPLKNFFD